MKVWEICKEENLGKKYMDKEYEVDIYEVVKVGKTNSEYDLKLNGNLITDTRYISEINNMEFEEYKEHFIEKGQKYYFIDGELGIYEVNYHGDTADKKLLSINNMYPFTEENKEEVRKEVELIRDRKKLQAEMEIFARENNTEKIYFNNKKTKYYLDIDYRNKKVLVDYSYQLMNMNTVYYSSKEIVRKALEKFGARIKELYIDAEIGD